jgi:hypothetical protein
LGFVARFENDDAEPRDGEEVDGVLSGVGEVIEKEEILLSRGERGEGDWRIGLEESGDGTTGM